MKKILVYSIAIIVFVSCGKSKDPKATLESLKKEKVTLDQKIKDLEAEIALTDTTTIVQKFELVTVATATKQPFNHYIELQGKVDAEQNVTVTPQMPGVIQKLYVSTGQQVNAGQVIAELDNDASKKNLETLETQLSFAKDIYAKQKSLWDQKIGSEVQYLSAKNTVETLEKSLSAGKEQLNMSKLISPISGIVDQVDIKIGQIASPGYNGVRIVNMANLKVKGEVSESYASLVDNGDNVILFFPDMHKEVIGKISFTSKVINPQTRTFTAESKLTNDGSFKPNMIVVMKIADYEVDSAMVVPVNLIQKSAEEDYIYLAVTDGDKTIAKRKTVTTGKIYDGKIEIISGINAGDKIITSGYQELVEGQLIQY